jgi:hypothetical protein
MCNDGCDVGASVSGVSVLRQLPRHVRVLREVVLELGAKLA